MFTQEITIQNKSGLHARPASAFANLCKGIESDIRIITPGTITNPKSIISILAAGLVKGTTATLEVEGPDEVEAGNKIVEFINALDE